MYMLSLSAFYKIVNDIGDISETFLCGTGYARTLPVISEMGSSTPHFL